MTREQQVAALYEELRMDVYRYVLTLGPTPETAQDVTHDAFVRLYEALHQGTVIKNARGWLLRVAHNLAINAMGAKSYATAELEESTTATVRTAEDHLIEEERRMRLRAEINRLSVQQRGCPELRAQGLRYREIGDIMGISTSAVGEFPRRPAPCPGYSEGPGQDRAKATEAPGSMLILAGSRAHHNASYLGVSILPQHPPAPVCPNHHAWSIRDNKSL
jgi:RNA polymerase sigma-70 factor (ECF subfamily)